MYYFLSISKALHKAFLQNASDATEKLIWRFCLTNTIRIKRENHCRVVTSKKKISSEVFPTFPLLFRVCVCVCVDKFEAKTMEIT